MIIEVEGFKDLQIRDFCFIFNICCFAFYFGLNFVISLVYVKEYNFVFSFMMKLFFIHYILNFSFLIRESLILVTVLH